MFIIAVKAFIVDLFVVVKAFPIPYILMFRLSSVECNEDQCQFFSFLLLYTVCKKRKYRNTVQSKYIKKKKIKSKLLQNMCTVTKVAFAFELATVEVEQWSTPRFHE